MPRTRRILLITHTIRYDGKPSNVALFLTDVGGAGNSTVTSSNQGACPASNVTVLDRFGVNVGPFAANGVTTGVLSAGVSLASSAPSACQNTTFTITYGSKRSPGAPA